MFEYIIQVEKASEPKAPLIYSMQRKTSEALAQL